MPQFNYFKDLDSLISHLGASPESAPQPPALSEENARKAEALSLKIENILGMIFAGLPLDVAARITGSAVAELLCREGSEEDNPVDYISDHIGLVVESMAITLSHKVDRGDFDKNRG